MPILRLAYTTLFLIALLAVFELWSQVGGQSHLDLMPWYLKLVLGVGAAFAVVKGAAAAVAGERAWNLRTLRWAGILLLLLIGCGLASYYAHLYLEEDEEEEQNVSGFRALSPVWGSDRSLTGRGSEDASKPGGRVALSASVRRLKNARFLALENAPRFPVRTIRKARRVILPAGPRRSNLTLYL
jgi:hypothetical protein